MKAKLTYPIMFAAALLALAGCPDAEDIYDFPTVSLGPVSAGDHIYAGNGSISRLLAIKAPEGTATTLKIPDWTVGMYRLPNRKSLMLLSHQPPTLSIIEGSAIKKSIPLRSPYEGLSIRSDGKVAAFYFTQKNRDLRELYSFDDRFSDEEIASAAVNMNEISFVNLETGETRHAAITAMSSKGLNDIVFANNLEGEGFSENLAAILTDSAVSLCDVFNSGEGEGEVPCRHIPLRDWMAGEQYVAQSAIFSKNNDYIFIRTKNLDDVIAVRIEYKGANILASFNMMTSPFKDLSGLHVLQGDEFKENILAVYGQQKSVAVLHAESVTSKEFTIENVPINFSTKSIVMNDGKSEFLVVPDSTMAKMAVIDINRGDYRIVETSYRPLHIQPSPDYRSGAVLNAPPFGDECNVMGGYIYSDCYDVGSGGRAVDVFTLRQRNEGESLKISMATISLSHSYSAYTVGSEGDLLYMILPGAERLVSVDLKNFLTSEIRIGRYSSKVGLTGSEKAVFVEQLDSSYGKLSIFPTGIGFSRKNGVSVEGYLVNDALGVIEKEDGDE